MVNFFGTEITAGIENGKPASEAFIIRKAPAAQNAEWEDFVGEYIHFEKKNFAAAAG